jgi:hypothetical protein
MRLRTSALLWLLILAAFCAYALPWLTLGGIGLTFNGYDLAEWTTLHPSVQGSTPTLFTSLLLRLPLVCVAIVVIVSRTLPIWLRFLLFVGLVIALLPPFEFLGALGNPNYRQQFGLSVFTFLAGIVLSRGFVPIQQEGLIFGLAILSAISSMGGVSQTYAIIGIFNTSVNVGIGFVLSVCFSLMIGIVSGFSLVNKTR